MRKRRSLKIVFDPVVVMIVDWIVPILRDKGSRLLLEVGLPLAEDVVRRVRDNGLSGEEAMREAIPRLEFEITKASSELATKIQVSTLRMLLEMAYSRIKVTS